MSVPSRSRKTAGQLSLLEPVIFETGAEFLRGHRRRPKFADDDRAGVVRDFGSLSRGRVTTERKGEEGNRRVARAGHVENLLSFRRDVMRLFSTLKQHHSLFAEGDEKKLRLPFL